MPVLSNGQGEIEGEGLDSVAEWETYIRLECRQGSGGEFGGGLGLGDCRSIGHNAIQKSLFLWGRSK